MATVDARRAGTEGMAALADEVSRAALDAGLDAVGVAGAEPFVDVLAELERRRDAGLHGGMAFTYRNPARSTDPRRILAKAAALVVGAKSYLHPPAPPAPGPSGVVARYSWIDEYRPLREALEAGASVLRRAGWQAVVVADDNALVDRAAAHRAGLGWWGKNANLLLPGHGSWFVLGSIVTDAPLPANAEPVPDGCGPCSRCLPACPTGALVAPGVLDARRCLAWLLEAPGVFPREHREALGGRIYGCDDCQEVCPPNRIELRRPPRRPAPPGAEAAVGLLDLLALDDDGLLARFGRWYVPERRAAYLRRNALVALGNVGDGADPLVEAALADALAHPHPIVRAHAVWAAARLGRRDLLDGLHEHDDDPVVVAELQALPDAR